MPLPRSFSTIFGISRASPQFLYLYDANTVISGDNPPITGGMRPAVAADFQSIVSGGVTIGAVAVTGGNIVINSGAYTPTFNILTAGQVQIPVGARSASVTVSSGGAYINGTGPFPVGVALKIGGYDGRFILGTAINVGCSGGNTTVTWET